MPTCVMSGRGRPRWAAGVLHPGGYALQCNVHGVRRVAAGGSSDVMNGARIGLGIMKASRDVKNDARVTGSRASRVVGIVVGRSGMGDVRESWSSNVDEKACSFVMLGRGVPRWAVGVLRSCPDGVQCNVHRRWTLASGGSSDVMEAGSIGLGTMKASSDVNKDASATG